MSPRSRRRILNLILATTASMAVFGASSAFAGDSTTTRYVALTGSVGAGTSCASPGYIGVPGVQAAMDAASSGDTIHLCAGTWNTADTTTGGGFVYYDKTLIVEGEGKNKTIIDGSGRTLPVLEYDFDSYSTGLLTVRDLTIQNGFAEAPSAINSAGSLTLEDVRIRNNGGSISAVGMLQSGGNLIIRRSELTGQAAGAEYPTGLVFSVGDTTIEDSTIADNYGDESASAGVAVFGSEGTEVNVDSSTFSGLSSQLCVTSLILINQGEASSGGISVTNSTFTGNTAGDGECPSSHILSSGYLEMRNSTFAGNTGVRDGGYGDGEMLGLDGLTLGNNIIVGDPNAEATCQVSGGTATSLFGNVISDGTIGCDDFVGGPAPSAQTKALESAIDLQPLADNGGPTETMALGARSVARGAAIAAECPATDQRGYKRDSACDSGAYEYGAGPGGKPRVKQKGRAGKDSLTVRVRCADSGPCRIRLSGVLKGGKGKLKSKTVKVRAGGKTVELPYTPQLERELRSNGGSGSVRVRAKEIGGGSASTLVRVTLPDPVTG